MLTEAFNRLYAELNIVTYTSGSYDIGALVLRTSVSYNSEEKECVGLRCGATKYVGRPRAGASGRTHSPDVEVSNSD